MSGTGNGQHNGRCCGDRYRDTHKEGEPRIHVWSIASEQNAVIVGISNEADSSWRIEPPNLKTSSEKACLFKVLSEQAFNLRCVSTATRSPPPISLRAHDAECFNDGFVWSVPRSSDTLILQDTVGEGCTTVAWTGAP